jgi:hypothetical protein
VLDLAAQLDRLSAEQHKYGSLLCQLLEAQRNRESEQLFKEQLALFEASWQARNPEDESGAEEDDDDFGNDASGGQKSEQTPNRKTGRTPAFGATSDRGTNRSRSRQGGKALQWLRQRPAARDPVRPSPLQPGTRVRPA